MTETPTRPRGRRLALWLAAWAIAMGLIYLGLDRARRWAVDEFGSADARDAWRQWQADERARADDPTIAVRRRPPKATEPPLLILLRDHFPAAAVTTLLIATFLFAFFSIVVPGAFRSRAATGGTADPGGPE